MPPTPSSNRSGPVPPLAPAASGWRSARRSSRLTAVRSPYVIARKAVLSSPSPSLSTDVSVLLVEDDPAVSQVVANALQARGYAVEVAATGRHALERVSITEPTIVVLDLGLPDMDGIDICRRLR